MPCAASGPRQLRPRGTVIRRRGASPGPGRACASRRADAGISRPRRRRRPTPRQALPASSARALPDVAGAVSGPRRRRHPQPPLGASLGLPRQGHSAAPAQTFPSLARGDASQPRRQRHSDTPADAPPASPAFEARGSGGARKRGPGLPRFREGAGRGNGPAQRQRPATDTPARRPSPPGRTPGSGNAPPPHVSRPPLPPPPPTPAPTSPCPAPPPPVPSLNRLPIPPPGPPGPLRSPPPRPVPTRRGRRVRRWTG
ncbi:UNVERIFIED_CONTAM: hypothetical protein RKD43_006150 [Streptomyces graminofaciens]